MDHDFQWSDVTKKLTWQNQLTLFEFYIGYEITKNNEIMKKASAWFRVTYKWLIGEKRSKKKSQRKRRRPEENNNQQRFLSFAWIVYPVLMEIYDKHEQ